MTTHDGPPLTTSEMEIWKTRNMKDAKENRKQLMSEAQERHLAEIKLGFSTSVDVKYRAGQAEHGGNVWERPALKELKMELLDAITYVNCAERQQLQLKAFVVSARCYLRDGDAKKVQECLDGMFELLHNPTE